nr:MAG TPA: hypothetical protein [Caudoviricetes sp.]
MSERKHHQLARLTVFLPIYICGGIRWCFLIPNSLCKICICIACYVLCKICIIY